MSKNSATITPPAGSIMAWARDICHCFELAIVAFLREHGFPFAERSYGAGRPDDQGDIDGIPGWCIEAKNCKAIDLAGWCAEASTEAANARSH